MKYIYIIVLLPGIAHLKTNMTTRKCFVLWLESLTLFTEICVICKSFPCNFYPSLTEFNYL